LKLAALTRLENGVTTELPVTLLQRDIATAINNAGFSDPRITQVYWPSEELFKGGSDEEDKKKDGEDDDETDSTND
jgi:hypothetical protein